VACDENGWPEMTMARRQLWFGPVMIMLDPRIRSHDRHDEAPWAFKVNGNVYEEYEYIDALARNRGYGSSTQIERVDNGAR
jgi:hypothetical protein